MLRQMLDCFEIVPLGSPSTFPHPNGFPDEDDLHLLAAAERGKADIIVLSDGGVLRWAGRQGSRWNGVRIMERDEAMSLLGATAEGQPESLEPDE